MEDSNINTMIIIKIKNSDIDSIECNYGTKDKLINVTNIIKNHITKNINEKKYSLSLKIKNVLFNCDPVPNKVKKLYIRFNNYSNEINENNQVIFLINLSFDIIFKKNINSINFPNYATIFGKGPTFKRVDKNKEELRCAVNQAANIAENVDLLCMNDYHNVFKIDLDVYKNLKYILIPEYLHIKQKFDIDGYFAKILNHLNENFNGSLIVYNLLTSPVKNPNFINLDTGISSGNTIYEFLCRYSNVSKVDIYGIGIKSTKNYNSLFIGNGNYNERNINKIINCLTKCYSKYKLKYTLN